MRDIIKNHWYIILPSFVVGLLIILPSIISILKTDNFDGIYPQFSGDEEYYLGITREVYDGGLHSGNAFIKEHKNDLAIQPLFFEALPAWEARLLGLSVPEVFVLNDFLLPFLGVILLYILFFSLTNNKLLSNIFSSLFYFIFLYSFNRPINPQLSFVFFVLGVFLIWKIISKKHDLKTLLGLNIFLGLVFSILVYAYPFYWTTIIVLYAVSSLLLIFKEREFGYWFKGYAVFGLTSILLLLPYGLNMLKVMGSPYFMAATLRTGLVLTHYPASFLNVALILFCLPVIYLSRFNIEDKRKLFFCYSLVLAGIILNWQNVLTGKILQFSSHYYPVIIFFIFLILAMLWKGLSKSRVAVLLTIVLAVVIIYKQKDEVALSFKNISSAPDISNIQNFRPAFDWLNKNTSPESVIYALGDGLDSLVPIYTESNNYENGYTSMYLMSEDELENRWIIQNFWNDLNTDYVKSQNNQIWGNKFLDTYGSKEVQRKILQLVTRKNYPPNILIESSYLDRILKKHSQFKKDGFEKALKSYEADYIMLDSTNSKYSILKNTFKQYKFLSIEAELGGIIIYKVNFL